MICKKHPKYQALRTPRSDCKECWEMYNAKKKPKQQPKADAKGKTKSPKKAAPKAKDVDRKSKPRKPQVPQEESKWKMPEKKAEEPGKVTKSFKLTKEEKAEIDSAIKEVVAELYEVRLREVRQKVSHELDLHWEHLYVYDNVWHPNMIKKLESEGWQWMSHSWPLVERGLVPGKYEYTIFKRIKRAGTKPIPDFTDQKTVKKYGGIIKDVSKNKKK